MENNEIMKNEEIIETTAEFVSADSGKSMKVVAGIGLSLLVSDAAYKYIIKPMLAKMKAKKNSHVIHVVKEEDVSLVNDEVEEIIEEN